MRWLLLVVLAVGCGGSQAATVRWTHVEDAAPIASVVVFESIQHEARVGILFRGFETRLQSRLEACRVQTIIRHGRPDADSSTTQQAWLTVVPDGGTYTMVSSKSDEDVRTEIDGSFKVEVVDQRVKKTTWRAVIDVKTGSTPDLSDGEAFAEAVMSRLHADGLVPCT